MKRNICSICNKEIDKQYTPKGKMFWDKGHNADPVNNGRCCTKCNETKVIPIRLVLMKQGNKNIIKNKLEHIRDMTDGFIKKKSVLSCFKNITKKSKIKIIPDTCILNNSLTVHFEIHNKKDYLKGEITYKIKKNVNKDE